MAKTTLLLVTVVVVLAFAFCAQQSLLAQQPKVKKSPAQPTSVASGQQMYEAYCASCHGRTGKGDGPAAGALKTPPTDLTTLAKQNGGKFPAAHVSEVIRNADLPAHGSKEMPVWGPTFRVLSEGRESDVHMRITNLTTYIESLQHDHK